MLDEMPMHTLKIPSRPPAMQQRPTVQPKPSTWGA